jgi:hypothetical protein
VNASAPLRRPQRDLALFDQRTMFVVVSGYPPVCVVAIYHGEHRVVAGTSVELPVHGMLPQKARCHRCRVWRDPRALLDDRLGWVWWCLQCVEVGVTRCTATHGRLPTHEEFWCPQCGSIRVQATDAPPLESDGRRRHICRDCRRQQFAKRQTCTGCQRRLRRPKTTPYSGWYCGECRRRGLHV